MKKRLSVFCIYTLSLTLYVGAAAYAQNVDDLLNAETSEFDNQVGVIDLPREFIPKSTVYNGFILFPKLEVSTLFNTNVFGEDSGEQSDVIIRTVPSLVVRKEYGSFEIASRVRANLERFMSFEDDNKDEFQFGIGGNYDFNSKWDFPFSFNYNRSFRERGSPQSASVLENPTEIETREASAGFVRSFNRLELRVIGKYNDFTFGDGITRETRTPVVFSDNDRYAYGGNTRLSYLFRRSPSGNSGHRVFLDLDVRKSLYENPVFSGGSFTDIKRDNTAYSATAGFATTYKGLIDASFGAGILSKDYDSAELEDVDSFDLQANVRYLFTPKLSFGFQADRFFSEDTDTDRGLIQTNYELSSAYEIYHNIRWNNRLNLRTFEFLDNDREDEDYLASTNLKYFFSHNFNSGLGVTYQSRKSTDSTKEFDRTLFILSLTGQL